MRTCIIFLFSMLIHSACQRETWTFYTKSCTNSHVVIYKSKSVREAKKIYKLSKISSKTAEDVTITSDDEKWAELELQLIEKYDGARIKGGSNYLIRVQSKKEDRSELQQLICDYWR